MTKKILKGIITSAKSNKTIVVEVTRKFKHPFYEKVIKRTKKYHAHDEKNKFKEGESVSIVECKPISKKKQVCSVAVQALLLPPCSLINFWYSLPSGKFSVPRNSMCSKKCARPCRWLGSSKCPTLTASAAADLFDSALCTNNILKPLARVIVLYCLVSFGLFFTVAPRQFSQ